MSEHEPEISGGTVEELIGERRLWTAVLVQAIEDWRMGTLRKRREAQEFLFEDRTNFSRVCAGAGVDPDIFSSKLLKIGTRIEMQGRWQSAQPV